MEVIKHNSDYELDKFSMKKVCKLCDSVLKVYGSDLIHKKDTNELTNQPYCYFEWRCIICGKDNYVKIEDIPEKYHSQILKCKVK